MNEQVTDTTRGIDLELNSVELSVRSIEDSYRRLENNLATDFTTTQQERIISLHERLADLMK